MTSLPPPAASPEAWQQRAGRTLAKEGVRFFPFLFFLILLDTKRQPLSRAVKCEAQTLAGTNAIGGVAPTKSRCIETSLSFGLAPSVAITNLTHPLIIGGAWLNLCAEVQGLSILPSARIRGKIPHGEWPKIALRFKKGETFTEIARSYGCTAPAIRYIVARTSAGEAKLKMKPEGPESGRMLAPPSEGGRTKGRAGKEDSSYGDRGGFSSSESPATDVWGRINSEIATFLAAMDSLSSDGSVRNYEELLAATDRLLWATARTRLELERILGDRKKTPFIRRVSG